MHGAIGKIWDTIVNSSTVEATFSCRLQSYYKQEATAVPQIKPVELIVSYRTLIQFGYNNPSTHKSKR